MEKSAAVRGGTLGTFAGVFTPSVLTILGIILFLRLGYVVGSAGLVKALVMIGIANLISVLTSFSLAAIATNMRVKGGGDYYLISRTLGLEFGGAIGLVLFLAQSVSIAFYCIGFGEAVSGILLRYGLEYSSQLIAFGAILFLSVLAFIGADLATKFQYVVMVFLILALVSFYTGGIRNWDTDLLIRNVPGPAQPVPFWMLFALFFPAVTGFTQGVSMSGDLRNPGESLPAGTFLAVGTSIIVYVTVALVFAASNSLDTLAGDYGAMKKTAAYGLLIDAGVISATLSSAMASFLGAPRILQSLAADKIFSFLNVFAKGNGKANNPQRGVVLSFGIAVAVTAIGQLDLIARVVAMFFLISYGLLNYATYFEAAADSPSFRPRFKWYNKYISLSGFVACLLVILAIDIQTGVAAAAVLAAIYQYLKRSRVRARWSDSRRSYHLQQIRKNLMAAQADLEHPRQWRPNILLLSNTGEIFKKLLVFSEWIEGRSGITTAVRIIQGSGFRLLRARQQYLKKLKEIIASGNHHAFALVISGIDEENTLAGLLQSYGIGPVTANTVVLDYDEVWTQPYTQVDMPHLDAWPKVIKRAGINQVFVHMGTAGSRFISEENGHPKQIDVWWQGDDASRLILLLAYLCTRHNEFHSARIRLFAVNYDRDNAQVADELGAMLEDVRIPATPKVVLAVDEHMVITESGQADLVFLPAGIKEGRLLVFKQFEPDDILPGLHVSALAVASASIDLQTDPEEGPVKELTRIHDELVHATKRSRMAKKEAEKAREDARLHLESIKESMAGQKDDLQEKIQRMIEAYHTVTESKQKSLKENAKLKAAERIAKEKGVDIQE